MTPAQIQALEALAGRALLPSEQEAIDAMIQAGNHGAIAAVLSVGRTKRVSRFLTARGVRTLSVLPRSRYALLTTLRDAAQQQPAWLVPVLTAAGVPVEDHPALADDLASAHGWIHQEAGLDVGTSAAWNMLDAIAAGVPAAADACQAVKELSLQPDPIHHSAVSAALQGAE